MSWLSREGATTSLLALFISITLLVVSPAHLLLRKLREQDQRLQSSLALLGAVGRLGGMSFRELQNRGILEFSGDPSVRVRLDRREDGRIEASFFLEGESRRALRLYIKSPPRSHL